MRWSQATIQAAADGKGIHGGGIQRGIHAEGGFRVAA